MIQNQLLDQNTFAELTFDRADHGWQVLLLRPLTIVQVCEDAHIPAVPDQTIAMLLSGETDVASGIDAHGRWAHTRPGIISMTVPGQPARLRWRARSDEPLQLLSL